MEKASVERKNTLIDDVEAALEHIRHDIVDDLLDHLTGDLESAEAHLHSFVLEMLHLSPEEVGASVLMVVEQLRDQVPAEARGWMGSAIRQLNNGEWYNAAQTVCEAAYVAYEYDSNRLHVIELFHNAGRLFKISDAHRESRRMEEIARDIHA